jgi:hypothetical protein
MNFRVTDVSARLLPAEKVACRFMDRHITRFHVRSSLLFYRWFLRACDKSILIRRCRRNVMEPESIYFFSLVLFKYFFFIYAHGDYNLL